MTGKRNRRGFLTVEDLKAGMREQYAILHNDRSRATVQLDWRPDVGGGGFYVTLTKRDPKGVRVEWREQSFADVDDARRKFAEHVRNNPRFTG